MYCLTNMCYVCLEKRDKSLININSSLSVNKDIIHIISDLPCNLGWLKTKRIVLICEECCRRLRETYQLLAMCHTNSARLQAYMDTLNTGSITTTDNESVLRVHLDNKEGDINEIKVEEEDEIYTFTREPLIEASEEVFENVEDVFVKEEDTWKMEAVDDEEEPPMNDNFTENIDKETDLEISIHSDTHDKEKDSVMSEHNNTHDTDTNTEIFVHSNTHDSDTDSEISEHNNTHDTDTDSDSSGFTRKPATNKKKLNAAGKKSYTCSTCSKSFNKQWFLERHTRVHTGEKPFKCSRCGKCFSQTSNLTTHMRVHTGEKPFECPECHKRFRQKLHVLRHVRTHTGT